MTKTSKPRGKRSRAKIPAPQTDEQLAHRAAVEAGYASLPDYVRLNQDREMNAEHARIDAIKELEERLGKIDWLQLENDLLFSGLIPHQPQSTASALTAYRAAIANYRKAMTALQ